MPDERGARARDKKAKPPNQGEIKEGGRQQDMDENGIPEEGMNAGLDKGLQARGRLGKGPIEGDAGGGEQIWLAASDRAPSTTAAAKAPAKKIRLKNRNRNRMGSSSAGRPPGQAHNAEAPRLSTPRQRGTPTRDDLASRPGAVLCAGRADRATEGWPSG